MKKFFRFLLILALLAGLGYGGYWLYTRYAAPEDAGETVSVTSVSAITGMGATGAYQRYTGVVEARNVETVNPGKDMTVAECYVKAGDTVTKGAPLFSYDTDSLTLSYEQLLIDITTLENKIAENESTIASNEKKLAKAKANQKKTYELKISTAELEKKKNLFELEDKQASAEKVRSALENATVYSPCAGRVRSVKSDSISSDPYASMMESDSDGYITIISGSEFCVKGTVSEQSVATLYQGMPVLIRSRLDENDVTPGEIYKIDTDQTVQNQNSYYYMGGSGESASKYAFYVSVPAENGFLIGQHVLLEAGAAGETPAEGLFLPAYYLVEEDGGTFVYAEGRDGRIEKRAVTTGAVDEAAYTVEILSGLSPQDKIAFPAENVKPGMKTGETVYAEAEA